MSKKDCTDHLDNKIRIIALAGNPNVGKSTIFNSLTGLKQHTGNWAGKTVTNASGYFSHKKNNYLVYDLPGTYSIVAHSKEEQVARDFVCFGNHDAVIVVCDAVCLEKSLNLVLQIIEITDNVVVCLNLMDEAKKKKIKINIDQLSKELGVPVVGTSARNGNGIKDVIGKVDDIINKNINTNPLKLSYCSEIEEAIKIVIEGFKNFVIGKLSPRFIALKLLDEEKDILDSFNEYLKVDINENGTVKEKIFEAKEFLYKKGIDSNKINDEVVSTIVKKAEDICNSVVNYEKKDYNKLDRKIDRFVTNKWTGIPIMILLMMLIFWITIIGANYPSKMLFNFFSLIEKQMISIFDLIGSPSWIIGIVVFGVYRTVTWVTAVMLPPMVIFFPLFTLLEDFGYLPRIAFNLDKTLKKSCACGKQALTMCMGFGCNAVGVVGCRIIDSPRERLIAIITNNFVPCNGRFPSIIAIITIFFVGIQTSVVSGLLNVTILFAVILIGVIMTLLVSKLLSMTILRGVPSFFTLELPPYRKPQIGKVIVSSIFNKTLFVLKRAIYLSAPFGILIWVFSNITINDINLLKHISIFLDPFAKTIGLDGVILTGFILGFPANEIVIPIIMMSYTSNNSLMQINSLVELKELLINNNWTWLTALCFILFSLMHFPCSTTCLTIKHETGSLKWMLISILIPTFIGITMCFIISNLVKVFGLI